MESPTRYAYATITYAKFVGGGWTYWTEQVQITNDLDNSTTFCNQNGW